MTKKLAMTVGTARRAVRNLALLAAVAVAIGARAATETVGGYTWTYQIIGDTAEIYDDYYSAAISPSPTGAVTIPSTLGDKPVTSIRFSAFYNCHGLTSVTIPDSVTSIGGGAFDGCSDSLFDATTIPGVKLVDGWAVGNTGSLSGNLNLTGARGIGDWAFYGCYGLTSVTIPDSVTSIGSQAFYGCSGLTSVTIPDSVTSIGDWAFEDCSGLMSISVGPENANYKSVNGLLLSKDGTTLIQGVNGDVTIPNSVTNIGSSAFSGCSGLTSVTIPDSVTSIGSSAFSGCNNALFDTTTIPGVKLVDGWAVGTTGSLSGNLNLTGARGIGSSAFYNCRGLTSVTIPDSVTSIGSYAFSGCSGLTSVTIPDSVTSIGYAAFSGCGGIRDVTISQGVLDRGITVFPSYSTITNVSYSSVITNIGSYAFGYCSGLTSVTIPDSVTSIGDGAFYNCSGLTSVTIGNGVTSIGYQAFEYCSGLTSVAIPDSVTSIGDWAFSGCSGLTSVTIGNGVTNIGYDAFYGCSGLTSVTIPNSVTSIGERAFDGCSGLTSVTIPDSVTSIGDWAFEDCSGIRDVTISQGVLDRLILNVFPSYATITNVSYSSVITNIGSYAFSGCSGLTRVTIPDSVTSIGGGAFDGCSDSLFDATTIPGVKLVDGWAVGNTGSLSGNLNLTGARGIGDYAFKYCSGLTSVTIPDSVTSIGNYAFSRCGNLSSVMFQGDCPQNVPYTIYENTPGTLTTYVSRYANGWGDALPGGIWNGRAIALLDLADDEPPFDCVENPGGTVTLKEYKGIAVEEIYIPSSIGGHAVSAIAGHAFESCPGLRSVTVPATVTWLGDEAFAGCSSLVSVTYLGDAPDTGRNIYKGTPRTLVSYVTGGTIGWSGGISAAVPEIWNDRGMSCEWTVTFDSRDGTSREATRVVASGGAVGELPTATRSGYTLDGWFTAANGGTQISASTKVTANVTYYAHWTPVTYTVTFNANGGTPAEATKTLDEGTAIGSLPTPTRSGYLFVGWFTAATGGTQVTEETVVTGDVTYYAHWTAAGGGDTPTPTPEPPPTPPPTPTPAEGVPVLWSAVPSDAVPTMATTYDGYLYKDKTLVGTIQVKVGKPNKDNLAAVKATVIGLDGKKKNLKAADRGKAVIAADGPSEVELVGGEACTVTLGAKGMSGRYGAYVIDGGLNVFMSRESDDKATASAALGKWQGAVNVAWRLAGDGSPYQTLTVTIANKGKAKVTGTLADGTKVTASSQLVVGEDWCCVPVVEPKKAKIAFEVWLPMNGRDARSPSATDGTSVVPVNPFVAGLGDAIVGKPGTLKGGAKFRMGATLGDAKYADFLPNGVPVTVNGAKWTLPKAGKVAYLRGTTDVDAAKLLENPSALKLTCTAKTGAFKGSFKAYAEVNGKPKATTVNVAGVLIDGVGYSAATVKKVGSVPATIE